MTTPRRRQALALALASVLVAGRPMPAAAHNERIHQSMTDYAYHLALAMSQMGGPGAPNPLSAELATLLGEAGMAQFVDAAKLAVPKLRALPSGLPHDPAACDDAEVEALTDDNNDQLPDWQFLFGTLAEQTMGFLIYPVTVDYASDNTTCEIDKLYRPIGSMAFANPATGATPKLQFASRDHTGVTLGYWAGGPDRAVRDWIFRSTTLETIKSVGGPLSSSWSALALQAPEAGGFP